MLRYAILPVLLLQASSAQAGQCVGKLYLSKNVLILDSVKDESICIIGRESQAAVLRGCQLGDICQVDGVVELCKDSGECVVISDVKRASRR